MFKPGKRDLPAPAMCVGCPLSSPTTTMYELTSLLPLAPRPGGGCQGHLSSPEWCSDRQATEHRVSIVPPGAQASHYLEGAAGGLRLLLKPSVCHLAWIVTIVRPQQRFVSDSISLFASQPSPTPPWGFALRRVERLRRVGESTGLGVQRPQNVTSSL